MALVSKGRLAAGASLLLAGVTVAAPATAHAAPAAGLHPIPRTSEQDCGDRNDFLLIRTATGDRCYSDAGDLDTQIHDAYSMNAGNNAGWLRFDTGYVQNFDKYGQAIFLNSTGHSIVHIHIN